MCLARKRPQHRRRALATGEFLAFLDSDDKLPTGADARMLAALERSGSDFATGNVHRVDGERQWPAAFLSRRRQTHASRMRWLRHRRPARPYVTPHRPIRRPRAPAAVRPEVAVR